MYENPLANIARLHLVKNDSLFYEIFYIYIYIYILIYFDNIVPFRMKTIHALKQKTSFTYKITY